MHALPHAVPSQVLDAFDGTGHGAQPLPQVAVEASLTHAAPQRWVPGRQRVPQETPSQVATRSLGGVGHGVHPPPQLAREVSLAQPEPQR